MGWRNRDKFKDRTDELCCDNFLSWYVWVIILSGRGSLVLFPTIAVMLNI